MRSIALLVFGLVTGIVVGIFVTPHFKVTTTTAAMPSAVDQQKKREIPSPFTPVASSIGDESSTKTTPSEADHTKPATPTTALPPGLPVTKIQHYREALAYLQHIDNADIGELQNLLFQLENSRHDSPFTRTIVTAIFQRFGETDIETALQTAISANDNPENYSPWAHEGLAILASLNPDYVQEKIDQFHGTAQYSELQNALYMSMASKDPEKLARSLIEEHISTNQGEETEFYRNTYEYKYDAISMAISEWAIQDPQSVWAFLNNEASEEFKSVHSDQVLSMWFDADPDSAVPEIAAMLNNNAVPLYQQEMLTDLYISHLSQTDPQAASQWALSQADPMLKQIAVNTVLRNWNHTDADGLNSFVNQLEPELRDQYMPMAISNIAMSMARTDPQSAMDWAEQLPESQSHEAKMSIVSEWVHTDPNAAADWLFNLPETPANQELIQYTAGSFLYTSPENAKLFFSSLPADTQVPLTADMIQLLGPETARQWLNEQTNMDVRQFGSAILDATSRDKETSTVLEALASMHDSGSNINPGADSMLFYIVHERMAWDRVGVLEWIANTNMLSQEDREMLKSMTSQIGRY